MSVCWTQQCFCIKMRNLIVDPEFFIENMDVLPSIPVCRFVCKNGKENTDDDIGKLFWNLQVVGISCWEIIFCLNHTSNKALKHQTQSYNKYMGMSHTLQTVHNNRAHLNY